MGFADGPTTYDHVFLVRDDGDYLTPDADAGALPIRPVRAGDKPLYIRTSRVFERLKARHKDIFDFLVVVTDDLTRGLPESTGGTHLQIHQAVRGIGCGEGVDHRERFHTKRLMGASTVPAGLLKRQPVYGSRIVLHELGHQWLAFASYADEPGGAPQRDHLFQTHWARGFNVHRSPAVHYHAEYLEDTDGLFHERRVISDAFCDLDLYFMGLLPASEVGPMWLLNGLTALPDGRFSARKKVLTIDNFLWANGPREPARSSVGLYQMAFVLLTRDPDRAVKEGTAELVNECRKAFEILIYQASRKLLLVRTNLC